MRDEAAIARGLFILAMLILICISFGGLRPAVAQQDFQNIPTLRNVPPEWTKPKYMAFPPVEYDHYYDGDLTIKVVPTLEELRIMCNLNDPTMLACAIRTEKTCVIYLVEDSVVRTRGWNTGILLRHEIGHCNGWGVDHAGERPLPWPITHLYPLPTREPTPRGELPPRRKDETRCCGQ